MAELIQIAVEKVDQYGSIVKRKIVAFKDTKKPEGIVDLGLRHTEQINILKEIQDVVLEAQIQYVNDSVNYCPNCGKKLAKKGYTKSEFNAVLTDHKVPCSRKLCSNCNFKSIPSIRSIFGTQVHPDLAKIQVELSGKLPYRSAQKILNMMVSQKRKANNHNGLKNLTESVGAYIDSNPADVNNCNIEEADELIIQVDGGHVKTVEEQRSIEALTSVIYNPKNINSIGGKEKKDGSISQCRGEITSKSCAASALSDNQDSIKFQTLRAAKLQGLSNKTKVTALCDGASNCWSVIDSLAPEVSHIDRILDWFHIAMKFKNTGLGNTKLNKKLESAKWYLWHGDAQKCIENLTSLREDVEDDIKKFNKVDKLKTYIENNRSFIAHYSNRKNNNLIFTSNMAEATVESLINQRCKNKQHMRWSRKGLHAILVVRSATNSDQWENNWEGYISGALKKVA